MKKTNGEFKQLIFDLMNGHLNLEYVAIEESSIVENEFEEGKICYNAYSEILDTYDRLCQRLEVGEEDDDLEIIINNFNIITEHLCKKMFDYGVLFS